MSPVIHVNQKQFETEVRNSQIPVLVDFYANWCAPCRALEPILDRLAEEFDGQIKFVKVNSDEEPALVNEFRAAGLPTIVLIEGGQVVDQFSGLPQERALRTQLENWVESRTAKTR